MPVFRVGDTQTTTTPTILVEDLEVGRHVFQLVVEDDSGNKSQEATVEVIVRDTRLPTAIIEAVPPVEAGARFNLDGRRSSDVAPGQIRNWVWTRLADVGVRPPIDRGPLTPIGPVIERPNT